MSAAFFSSDETVAAGPANVVPFRRNQVMYWLPIAAGTIAATLVIWLGVREKNEVMPQAQSVVADSRAAETPAPAVEGSRLQDQQGQQGTSAPARPQGNTAAPADAKRLEQKAAPAELRADRMKKEAASTTLSRRIAAEPVASPAAKAAAPPPPAAMPPPPQPVAAPPITSQATPPPPVTVAGASPVIPTTTTARTGAGQAGVPRGSALFIRDARDRRAARRRGILFFAPARPGVAINGLPPAGVVGGAPEAERTRRTRWRRWWRVRRGYAP